MFRMNQPSNMTAACTSGQAGSSRADIMMISVDAVKASILLCFGVVGRVLLLLGILILDLRKKPVLRDFKTYAIAA